MARYLKVNENAAAARYKNNNATFQIMNYPERPAGLVVQGETDATRMHNGIERPLIASEHRDNGGLSLSWQDEPGLQFQTPAGDWLDVPNTPGGISVHLSETLETQASHRFAATPHRVLDYGKLRRSIVFFFEPGLFSSTTAFSHEEIEAPVADEDTYAASLLETLRRTGRAR